jgi:hypothetical protein
VTTSVNICEHIPDTVDFPSAAGELVGQRLREVLYSRDTLEEYATFAAPNTPPVALVQSRLAARAAQATPIGARQPRSAASGQLHFFQYNIIYIYIYPYGCGRRTGRSPHLLIFNVVGHTTNLRPDRQPAATSNNNCGRRDAG